MKHESWLFLVPGCAIFFALVFALPAHAAEAECVKCHAALAREKVVHPALQMGCPTCHTDIDTTAVPHKVKGKVAKGLSAAQPDLCFTCHDKATFTQKTVHPALAMGCTSCHNPHSSKNAKLLVAAPPALCFNCHDRNAFKGKITHAPVARGACVMCHHPHSSDHAAMLRKEPVALCLDCHAEVRRSPHVISSFAGKGHPLGDESAQRSVADPLRPGKKFSCLTCHEPHKSELAARSKNSPARICEKCHKM
jgi:predicted CXXCH cytochrome family protein